MKNSFWLSLFALLVAIAGLMIALIAYFKRRSCVLCDDLEEDMVEFYDDEDECDCGEDCDCQHDCCQGQPATATIVTDEPAQ